ncbi:MAG: hypothetical protein ACLFSF_05485 [Desulfonatronovibrio sp.]
MNQQKILMTALFTLIAAMVLAAGSYFLVKPMLEPDLTRPDPPPAPAAAEDAAQENLQALSLEQITGTKDSEFDPRDVARNPFLWPRDQEVLLAELDQEKQDQELSGKDEEDEALDPALVHKLKVIMIGETGRVAFIDRKMVLEGDMLGDNRVKSIEPLQVILATPDQEEIELTMDEAPRLIAHHEPEKKTGQEETRSTTPKEEATDAEKMEYLMREMQMMQQGGGI